MIRFLPVMIFTVFLAGPAAAADASRTEIEEALTCQCGCGLTVHSCNHLNCGFGVPLKQEVAALVSEGRGHDEILVHFREKYGEKILSSPVAEGFNLTAWILPFVMLALGAGAVVLVIFRWTARPSGPPRDEGEDTTSDEDRRRIEKMVRDDL